MIPTKKRSWLGTRPSKEDLANYKVSDIYQVDWSEFLEIEKGVFCESGSHDR